MWRGRAPEKGFTLLEVLVALAIVGVAVVALLELSSQSLRLVKSSGDFQGATLLADRLAVDSRPTQNVVDTGSEGPYQWERRISEVPVPEELVPAQTASDREPPRLFAVAIDVRWGRNQTLELVSLRTPTTPPAVPGLPASGAQEVPAPATSGQRTGSRSPAAGTRPSTGLPFSGSTRSR